MSTLIRDLEDLLVCPVEQHSVRVESLRDRLIALQVEGELLTIRCAAAMETARRLKLETEALMMERTQLQGALDSRVVIEQAKGVLAERYGISVEEGFVLLLRYCRDHNLKLRETASAVVEGRPLP